MIPDIVRLIDLLWWLRGGDPYLWPFKNPNQGEQLNDGVWGDWC